MKIIIIKTITRNETHNYCITLVHSNSFYCEKLPLNSLNTHTHTRILFMIHDYSNYYNPILRCARVYAACE